MSDSVTSGKTSDEQYNSDDRNFIYSDDDSILTILALGDGSFVIDAIELHPQERVEESYIDCSRVVLNIDAFRALVQWGEDVT